MRRAALVAFVLAISLFPAYAATLQVTPTTTLAAETGNNTSASNLWVTSTNGDLGAGNISKVDVHTLLYPGFSGKIYAHLMGWFCMTSGSTAVGADTLCGKHIQIGYNSNDPKVVQAQVNDMISRGFDGVIHDWYGPGKTDDDIETKNYMSEAQQHLNFTFALMIDKGAVEWFSCYPNCTATQALLQITQYAASTFFTSPAYMRINGRPVLTNFDLDLHFTIDWNYVAANTPGNPIFLFQNGSGFTHVLSSGSYAWVMPDDSNYGLDYLGDFYTTGMQHTNELTVGAMYKGFNDTLASWSGNRVMSQQCGQTWLETFDKANSMYNSSNQLGAIQLVTWDDYEEGTELESGIDNCFSLSAMMSGTAITWTINGDESTIDHYTVFISTDGQDLMPLGDFPVGTRQLDLAQYSPVMGTTYTLYVKAVAKPSLHNQMSGPVTLAYTTGVHMTPSNGATIASPFNVSAYALSANPISAMIVYLDNNEVYRTYSGGLSTDLTTAAGSHLLVTNAWDNTGTLMQSKATINVVTQPPVVSLSLSSTSAYAPATITASTSGSTDPNAGATLSSVINWGDGATSVGATSSHIYNKAGSYTVTATVTDNYGLSATTAQALTISSPSVTITTPVNGATVASPVHVTANAVSGSPISAIIIYLDGTEVYRTYSATVDTNITMAAGQHGLTANAWDNTGLLLQSKIAVTATGPTAVLALSNSSGVAPLTVIGSTSGSTDIGATLASSSIAWGDGATSAGPTATHTYATAGSYKATATVTDSLGLSSTSAAQNVTVQAVAPKDIAISVAPPSAQIRHGESAQFTLTLNESGASDPISVSCSNLPAGATCSFASPTITPTGQTVSDVLTISTSGMAALRHRDVPLFAFWMPTLFLLAGTVVGRIEERNGVPLQRRLASLGGQRLTWRSLIAIRACRISLLLALLILQLACGGGSRQTSSSASKSPTTVSTSATTYSITINATSGTVTRSTNVTLAVQ